MREREPEGVNPFTSPSIAYKPIRPESDPRMKLEALRNIGHLGGWKWGVLNAFLFFAFHWRSLFYVAP